MPEGDPATNQQQQPAVPPAAPSPPPPAAPQAPAVTAPPAPAPPTPTNTAPQDDPAWLGQRLERERRAWLKELGIENPDDAKKAFTSFKAEQDAKKTEAERTAEKLRDLDREKARADGLAEVVAEHVSRKMSALSDEQRAAVKKIAGDDAAGQLKAIDALEPTWKATPATSPTQGNPAPPSNGDTAPPRGAPPTSNTTPPNRKAEYEALVKKNPIHAAAYLNVYRREIYPESN